MLELTGSSGGPKSKSETKSLVSATNCVFGYEKLFLFSKKMLSETRSKFSF